MHKQITRKRLQDLPPNPLRIEDLHEKPEQYRHTLAGSTFLLYDSYDDDEEEEKEEEEEEECGRILVFSTLENITRLFECTMWFVDGTFKTAPTIFFQLFSILGDVKQAGVDRKPQIVALSFVHVLLENKRQVAYSKVFSIVIEAANDLSIVNVPSLSKSTE